ncbi:MAG: hypothetical protein WA653_10445, partial [Candidatus Sulfotelmatobacter sp.]
KIARRFNAGSIEPYLEPVPLGTAEVIRRFVHRLSCASGTRSILWGCNPASKLAGYYRWSLQDLL